VPVIEVAVAKAIVARLAREHGDDTVLSLAFGAGLFRHCGYAVGVSSQ